MSLSAVPNYFFHVLIMLNYPPRLCWPVFVQERADQAQLTPAVLQVGVEKYREEPV